MNGAYQADQAAAYHALGLLTVVDLRSDVERARTPSAWGLATGATVIEVPIPDGAPGGDPDYHALLRAGSLRSFTAGDLGRFYCTLLDKRAPEFGDVVRLLSRQGNLPALIHCSAGKDRTGLVVALVLEVLGTPRHVILGDYSLTGVNRPDRIDAYSDQLAQVSVQPAAVRVLFDSPEESLRVALAHLDRRYDGAAEYLRAAGSVTQADLDAIRGHLVA